MFTLSMLVMDEYAPWKNTLYKANYMIAYIYSHNLLNKQVVKSMVVCMQLQHRIRQITVRDKRLHTGFVYPNMFLRGVDATKSDFLLTYLIRIKDVIRIRFKGSRFPGVIRVVSS